MNKVTLALLVLLSLSSVLYAADKEPPSDDGGLAELIEAIIDLEGYIERKMQREMKKVEQQHKNDEDPDNTNNDAGCDRDSAKASSTQGQGQGGGNAGGNTKQEDDDFSDNDCGSDLSKTKSGVNQLSGNAETYVDNQVQLQSNPNYMTNQLKVIQQLRKTMATRSAEDIAKEERIAEEARADQEAKDAEKELQDNLDKLDSKSREQVTKALEDYKSGKKGGKKGGIGFNPTKNGVEPQTNNTTTTPSSTEEEKYPITVVDIAKTTLGGVFQCLDYEVIGLCVYIVYTPPLSVEIVPVFKISHLNPEFVVTAHDKSGKTPWKLMANTAGTVARTLQKSIMPKLFGLSGEKVTSGSYRSGDIRESTRFKEVNVFGHPLANVLENIRVGETGLFCESKIDILKPYFMSEIDYAWRSPLITLATEAVQDGPKILIPGYRELNQKPDAFFSKNTFTTWGALFPRTGFVLQQQPAKAAALTVQRAIDIVLHKKHLPHIAFYHDPETDYKTKVLNLSNPEKTKAWQMIKPVEKTECEAFGKYGKPNDEDWGVDIPDKEMAEKEKQAKERVESYSWNNWTPYKCCMPHRGWLLFSFEW